MGVTLFFQPGPAASPALPSAFQRSASTFERSASPASAASAARSSSPAPSAPEQEALDWIKASTGLSWSRIANLLGVTRQTIHDWRRGVVPFDRHAQRLYVIREILERAAERHSDSRRLRAWLDTPRGVDARTPAQLLEAEQFDRARLLALASSSPGLAPPPAWLSGKSTDPDRVRPGWRREPARPEPDAEPVFELG